MLQLLKIVRYIIIKLITLFQALMIIIIKYDIEDKLRTHHYYKKPKPGYN